MDGRWLPWNTSYLGYFTFKVGLAGIPPWLPFLHWVHFFTDYGTIMNFTKISLLKIFGEIVDYQL